MKNLEPGHSYRCKVVSSRESDHYRVELIGFDKIGLLKSDQSFEIDSYHYFEFVGWSELGQAQLKSIKQREEAKPVLPKIFSLYADGTQVSFGDVFGQTQKESYGSLDQPRQRYKRAIDYIIPHLPPSEYIEHDLNRGSLENLISQMILAEFTGCVILLSDIFISRAAVILYKGNCVGALYSNNFGKSIHETEPALNVALTEALNGEANVITYDLPENLVVPWAALHMGNSVETDELSKGARYFMYLFEGMQSEAVTGTISINLEEENDICFVIINQGNFSGYFVVQERLFSANISKLSEFLRQKSILSVKASILPPAKLNQRFGYPMDLYLRRTNF